MDKNQSNAEYDHLISQAQEAAFEGWDFSWLDERMLIEELPWDYAELAKSTMNQVESLLDMGTGGGEFLASRFLILAEKRVDG